MNMKEILAEAGCTLRDVVKTTILMTDINMFTEINQTYAEFFNEKEEQPARAAYEVLSLIRVL